MLAESERRHGKLLGRGPIVLIMTLIDLFFYYKVLTTIIITSIRLAPSPVRFFPSDGKKKSTEDNINSNREKDDDLLAQPSRGGQYWVRPLHGPRGGEI